MEGRLINIRKLVSLDITLHGPRFILAEFGIGTPVILVVGLVLAAYGQLLLGLYLFLTGVNYLPLLTYAIIAVRHGTAKQDVETDLTRDRHYVRKYSIQQFLIFIPFAIILLAIEQKLKNE